MRVLLVVCLVMLAGCMPPSENQLQTENDVQLLKRRLVQLEAQGSESASRTDAQQLQRQVAEIQAGLDNLRVEFQSINGRIDDLARQNAAQKDEMGLIRDDLGLQLNGLDARLNQLGEVAGSSSATVPLAVAATTAAARVAQTQAVSPVENAPQVQPEPVVAPDPEPEPEVNPDEIYQRAIDLIRDKKDFTEGRETLEELMRRYPEHKLYVNALYWTGEALYGEKQYERAILRLQDVVNQYPNHHKTPAAMLKQALAFAALGDKISGETTLRKLINDYPQSEQAQVAAKFLEQGR